MKCQCSENENEGMEMCWVKSEESYGKDTTRYDGNETYAVEWREKP